MTRATAWLLPAGLLLFAGILASQGVAAVFSTLALAKWGLLPVAMFHAVPLVLDAAAIRVLFDVSAGTAAGSWSGALLARWVGETANSLMPAGQIGGPVFMARHLVQRGIDAHDAVAAITVSTTFQTFAQVIFTLIGVLLLAAYPGRTLHPLALPLLIGAGTIGLMLGLFYLLQRRGLFAGATRITAWLTSRLAGSGRRDWTRLANRAEAIDLAVLDTHGRGSRIAATFALSLAGWLVGTGEVYWMLGFLEHPVSWGDALLLESLGQAIRAAGFAIPASLGVQEGGYLLLAPLAGLPSDVALALSLAKRAREVLWALPGLLYMHRAEKGWRRRLACTMQGE